MTRGWRPIVLALLGAAMAATAYAAEPEPRHGLSTFGDLKYPANFTHFDYADPNAPKGGTLSLTGTAAKLSFDSLNPFILKGDFPEGLALQNDDTGGSLVFDSLMAPAGDEPSSVYGLIASDVVLAPDGKSAVFHLRKEARWHDGTPLTADDVVFTVQALKEKGHPLYRFPLSGVKTVKAIDPYTVAFAFQGEGLRDLPLFVATLPIASKAYYKTHDFAATSMDPPLGSGPYKVGELQPGSYVTYDRVPDYWAKDLPVNRGRRNFDKIRFEFYRDRAVGFQAFTAGAYDLREEFTAKTWATEYSFPAAKDGRVKRLTLKDANPSGVQGFFLNTRRPQLADPVLRRALNLAFDFEWMNKNFFYGQYTRTSSYFQNSDMEAHGPPSAEERALLEPFKASLPEEVFGPVPMPPVHENPGDTRTFMREALRMLLAAGYTVTDGHLKDKAGKPVTLEFLADDSRLVELTQPYVQSLRVLGIDASVRLADPAQYQRRLKSFDFDITSERYSQRLTPGIELRQYFGSSAADNPGSNNVAGVRDPVVDALIEDVIRAKSREEMLTATRALDRVLRAGTYWVPHWYKPVHTIAYWDKFGRPAAGPKYQRGIIDTWWVDPKKMK